MLSAPFLFNITFIELLQHKQTDNSLAVKNTIIGNSFMTRFSHGNKHTEWKYEMDKDNKYCRAIYALQVNNVKPVNGLIQKNKEFDHVFTFIHGEAKSQIDFPLTDDIHSIIIYMQCMI